VNPQYVRAIAIGWIAFAGCTSPQDGTSIGAAVARRFFQRTAVTIHERRIVVAEIDSPFEALPTAARRDLARGIARTAIAAVRAPDKYDSVSVVFTHSSLEGHPPQPHQFSWSVANLLAMKDSLPVVHPQTMGKQ
jgi:hypothetical protein